MTWDEATFAAALERVSHEGVIEARGVRFGAGQLRALLEAAPRSAERSTRCELKSVDFGGASFAAPVDFDGVVFMGRADFENATFAEGVDFRDATFAGYANFRGATVSGEANFGATAFTENAVFSGAALGNPSFAYATFAAYVDFSRASFVTGDFFHVAFGGHVNFSGATFDGGVDFDDATFAKGVGFLGAVIAMSALFRDTHFTQARQFGPLTVLGDCDMSGSVFEQAIVLRLNASRLFLRRAMFRSGADIFLRDTTVLLEEADFAAPSLIAELTPEMVRRARGEQPRAGAEEAGSGAEALGSDEATRNRVLSVSRAKVAQLTLAGLDLRACRFIGAHGLDGLRLEQAQFAQPPFRWMRRQTIAEEHHVRAEHERGFFARLRLATGEPARFKWWYEREVSAPDWLEDVAGAPDPDRVAGVYRALRKGLEDNRDEPGAADFYYGEMEMRRLSSDLARAARGAGTRRVISAGERQVLWLYWLLAGYGLRASRAFAALAVMIALAAIPLEHWGIRPHLSYLRAVLFAAESCISLLHTPTAKLTAGGQVVEILLRIAGPVLFGLALLALRGRIKR